MSDENVGQGPLRGGGDVDRGSGVSGGVSSGVCGGVSGGESSHGESNDDTYDDTHDDTHDNASVASGSSGSSTASIPTLPLLKYSRIRSLPRSFFNRDPVLCVHTHPAVTITATHAGLVHLARPDGLEIRTFKAHSALVLAIHTDGEYVATALMDGTVVIGAIADSQDIIACDFKRPVHGVALVKQYARSKLFVLAGKGGQVLLLTRNWLGQRVDTSIADPASAVLALAINDDCVVYATENGIFCHSLALKRCLLHVPRPPDAPRADLYWPRIQVVDPHQAVVAWAYTVWHLAFDVRTPAQRRVVSGDTASILSAATFRLVVSVLGCSVEELFTLDELVAGAVPYANDLLLVLTHAPGEPPELRVVASAGGEPQMVDEVPLADLERLGLNDFHLCRWGHLWMLVSARDGVEVAQLSIHDQILWLTSHRQFKQAWEMGEHVLDPVQRLEVGSFYADALVEEEDWGSLAQFLPLMLHPKQPPATSTPALKVAFTSAWDKYARVLLNSQRVATLALLLPGSTSSSVYEWMLGVDREVYTSTLLQQLESSRHEFVRTLARWDPRLFHVGRVEEAAEEWLELHHDTYVREGLCQLYIATGDAAKALPHMLVLRRADTMLVVLAYGLIGSSIALLPQIVSLHILESQLALWRYSASEGLDEDAVHQWLHVGQPAIAADIDLLVRHRHEAAPLEVLGQFDAHHLEFASLLYLERLADVDPAASTRFQDRLVELTAFYAPQHLALLLHRLHEYLIGKAIAVCEQRQATALLVYLLGRSGQNHRALLLIIDVMEDPEYAIQFTRLQHDQELWERLIRYLLDKPAFIRALIELAGTGDLSDYSVDPVEIVRRIPPLVEVQGLRQLLTRISNNNDLSLLVHQKMYRATNGTTRLAARELLAAVERGVAVDNYQQVDPLVVTKIHHDGRLEVACNGKGEPLVSVYRLLPMKLTRLAGLA